MANRESFVAGAKKPESSMVKYMNSLKTGDKITVYEKIRIYDGENHVWTNNLEDDEDQVATVLFTTPDSVIIRHPNASSREIVVFNKNGIEVDPEEQVDPEEDEKDLDYRFSIRIK